MQSEAVKAMPIAFKISPLPSDPQVAMAYVPYQNMGTTYEADEALSRGTLFPELDKPFLGERGFSI